MAYIEDASTRVTVASKQPLGVASLNSGQLEIMLDRRLSQDDNRGVGQGVLDNISPTLNSFRILVEPRINSCKVRFFSISDRGLVLCIRDLFFVRLTGCKESTGWISFFGCP
jgi:Glycosyl hydrolases family 38 C-terminal domain